MTFSVIHSEYFAAARHPFTLILSCLTFSYPPNFKQAGRVVIDENRRMDTDTEEGLNDKFLNVYSDVPVNLIENIEVSVESGYHAGEVHLEEGTEDVSEEESYQTNFVSSELQLSNRVPKLTFSLPPAHFRVLLP